MHAYLIIAHKNIEQIKILMRLLDYSKNDIYIHIDAKADKSVRDYDFSKCCKCSRVYQYSSIKTAWGSYNLIECEIMLMQKAAEKGRYGYYHLISGSDLPLHSQEYIHDFFDKNKGKQFVQFSGRNSDNDKLIERRIRYYWCTSYYNLFGLISFKAIRKLDYFQIQIQKALRVNRIGSNKTVFYQGAQWFSITDDLVRELLGAKEFISQIYRSTNCCDEVFLQTYIHEHSEWMLRLYKQSMNNDFDSIVRKIDWNRGGPYTWRKSDYQELISSNCLFARKFDLNVDKEIIENIDEHIMAERHEYEEKKQGNWN